MWRQQEIHTIYRKNVDKNPSETILPAHDKQTHYQHWFRQQEIRSEDRNGIRMGHGGNQSADTSHGTQFIRSPQYPSPTQRDFHPYQHASLYDSAYLDDCSPDGFPGSCSLAAEHHLLK